MAEYHSPWHSMRTGITDPDDNIWSYSDFRQTVTVPLNDDTYTLGMWLYMQSGELLTMQNAPEVVLRDTILIGRPFSETVFSGDKQYLVVLNHYGYLIDTLMMTLEDNAGWVYREFDLSEYTGMTISLQWGTHNNGIDGVSAMYVDDVTLQQCP